MFSTNGFDGLLCGAAAVPAAPDRPAARRWINPERSPRPGTPLFPEVAPWSLNGLSQFQDPESPSKYRASKLTFRF